MRAPILDDEADRLRVLYQYEVRDTLAEQAFDELAELASTICGTPIATITMVDRDRQWFKSAVGLARGETAREISFCAHAIAGADVMQVPDAQLDERFASNPLVTGDPNIRFYAGAPLLTTERHAIGTICVIDRVPRALTPEQESALETLSRQVMAQLEFRRALQNLGRLDAERDLALRRARDQAEQLVAERTYELEQTNANLRAEVQEHRQTAEALRQSREQFLQAQKMEALGLLAGGIAHDFNNILTAIMGYSTLLCEASGPACDENHATEILRAAERGAGLSKQLLTLSRRQTYEPTLLDPEALIGSVKNLLRQVIGDRILLATEIDGDLGCVKADGGQLEQVLLNLAINARDAMPGGGTITIMGRNVSVAEGDAPISTDASAFVALTLKDDGNGIAPDVLPRIFEPFFTTKRPGHGTGLGLATCRTIAEQSGGWMTCRSEVGQGTAFTIYLPAVEGEAAPIVARETGEPPRGDETVLVVEDEPAVGELVALLLANLGYDVLRAEDGEQAEEAVASRSGRIDLVLTDMNMPRMDGRELITRLSAQNPDVKVILTSGNDLSEFAEQPGLEIAFLPKPFSMHSLAQRVREVLDGVTP